MCGGMSSDTEEELSLHGVEREEDRERVFLMRETDDEKYSCRKFAGARSFRLGLAISFVVVVVITVALAATVAALLLTSSSPSSSSSSSKFTLEDIFNSNFSVKRYSAEWTEDNLLIHKSSDTLTALNVSDNSNETLISSSEWAELVEQLGGPISKVVLSHDREWALLITNVTSVYRHSFLADYTLYNLNNGTTSNISMPSNAKGRIQLALWSPVQSVIAYVLDFDLHVYNITSDELVSVTSDGVRNIVYNGIPDWAYEEEVLSTNYALWWAPDGSKLLYARFNDSAVQEYKYPLYGSYLDPSLTQYTTIDAIAYPKPGTPNPTVSLLVTDLTDLTTHTLTPPPDTDEDHYFIFAGWTESSVAMVTWTNRSSDSAVYCLYREQSWQCEPAYMQTSRGWVELVKFPTLLREKGSILTLASQTEGDDSFIHILEISQGSDPVWRTSGEWEVTAIVSATDKDILYISTQTSPSQRHLYSAQSKKCLTCSQDDWNVPSSSNPSVPSRCDYFSASCSPSLAYCLLSCAGPAVPYTLLVQYDGDKLIPVQYMEVNEDMHKAIADLSLPTVDFFTVPETQSGEPSLNGQIMYPPGFQSSSQYPVLVYVYGGPNSQQVADVTLLSYRTLVYLCSNLSVIVVKVDGRGTGFRGDNFKYAVYHNLGHFETIDQIRAGRYLQGLKYVDSSKLAIYGASYGGYMAGMVGSSGSFVFSAAISQSPVTDWYYYDSIYTERYMDQPQNNQEGYKVSSVLERAKNLSDVDYLLIHGTGDDNVHFQHSAQLVQALTEDEIQFRVQFYTDKTHSLSGEHTGIHLYELIVDFLTESFGLKT